MRTVATILVIFLVRCVYLHAEPIPGFREDVGQFLGSDSCIFGVKSVSLSLYNSNFNGKDVTVDEICNNIDSSQQFVFIVHGFISSGNASSFRELASLLAEKGYIVFTVDWSQGACTDGIPLIKFAEYPSAVENTREIGQYIAKYVGFLIKCGASLQNMIFIGHSLGAHVSGFAAKDIQNLNYGTIPLIIAADPATPCFGTQPCKNRLCQSDAKCVKVLHTSTLGMSKAIGHQDFQFNNGFMQPECGFNVACSHTISIIYLSDILKNCEFISVPMKYKPSMFQSAPPYPSSNTTDCIVINDNILDSDNYYKGQFYVFVSKGAHCTENTLNCMK